MKSISTGTGDQGQTSLWSGERVDKDSIRVESYGTIDEPNSLLGEAKHHTCEEVVPKLQKTQRFLFKIAGQLATKDMAYIEQIFDEDINNLTEEIHHYENILKLKGFVIPGRALAPAKLDVCGTVARRAERRIFSLSKLESVPKNVLKYVNRLSDYLFILARYEEHIREENFFTKMSFNLFRR